MYQLDIGTGILDAVNVQAVVVEISERQKKGVIVVNLGIIVSNGMEQTCSC